MGGREGGREGGRVAGEGKAGRVSSGGREGRREGGREGGTEATCLENVCFSTHGSRHGQCLQGCYTHMGILPWT